MTLPPPLEITEVVHPRVLVYVAAPFSPTERQKANRQSVPRAYVYGRGQTFAAVAIAQNVAAASELGLRIAALGCMPIVPHTAHGGHPKLEQIQNYRFWIDATDELLQGCDAAYFSPEWQESSGARKEHATCRREGIPIFYDLTALGLWLNGTNHVALMRARCDRLFDRIKAHHDTERPPSLPADYVDSEDTTGR